MVLPWVQEAGSAAWDPSFQVGCAFVDVKCSGKDGPQLHFAIDQRMSRQLKVQNRYPLTGNGFFGSRHGLLSARKQLLHFRESEVALQIGSDVLKTHFDLSSMHDLPCRNAMAFLHREHNVSILAHSSGPTSSTLNLASLVELDGDRNGFLHHSASGFAVDYTIPIQTIRACAGGFGVCTSSVVEAFACEGLEEPVSFLHYQSSHNVVAFDLIADAHELCVLVGNQSTQPLLVNQRGSSRLKLDANSEEQLWRQCAYKPGHHNLIAFTGQSSRIILHDTRSAFRGFAVEDSLNPFTDVHAMAFNRRDGNLLACSSETEVRLFDLRYPRQSIMRFDAGASLHHLEFSAALQSEAASGCLFGVTAQGDACIWPYLISKDNVEEADGLLSITDSLKISAPGPVTGCCLCPGSISEKAYLVQSFELGLYCNEIAGNEGMTEEPCVEEVEPICRREYASHAKTLLSSDAPMSSTAPRSSSILDEAISPKPSGAAHFLASLWTGSIAANSGIELDG